MPGPGAATGDERLDRLEREVQRLSALMAGARKSAQLWRWLCLGGLIVASGALAWVHHEGLIGPDLLTAGVHRTLESTEFGLYNRDGQRVLLTDCDKFGYPNLIFMDLKKNYRMGVKVWPEGEGTPGLVFYDQSGIRGHYRIDENGASVLKLVGKGQKGEISLSVSDEGDPSLVVVDKAGKVLFAVPEGSKPPAPAGTSRSGASRG